MVAIKEVRERNITRNMAVAKLYKAMHAEMECESTGGAPRREVVPKVPWK